MAVADGVLTKNSCGGAQMRAWISPRSSAMRCSRARDVISRTRLFGSTSTKPIVDDGDAARDCASVVRTSPIGSCAGAAIAQAGDRRRASDRLHGPPGRAEREREIHAAAATSTQRRGGDGEVQRRGGEAAAGDGAATVTAAARGRWR